MAGRPSRPGKSADEKAGLFQVSDGSRRDGGPCRRLPQGLRRKDLYRRVHVPHMNQTCDRGKETSKPSDPGTIL